MLIVLFYTQQIIALIINHNMYVILYIIHPSQNKSAYVHLQPRVSGFTHRWSFRFLAALYMHTQLWLLFQQLLITSVRVPWISWPTHQLCVINALETKTHQDGSN